MACTSPITAFRSRTANDNGKRPLVFSHVGGYGDLPVVIPCGNCIGCRIDRTRSWALRCVHESKLHTFNSFVTLTYDDEHLPDDTGIDKTTLQLFFKRLRKAGFSFRYFACGEYGDTSKRPHYHVIFFGEDFHADRRLYKRGPTGNLYTSDALTKAWGFGHAIIASFSYQTAAYVASYVVKRRTGKDADEHDDYSRLEYTTGQLLQVQREFVLMSRRPGLGSDWYEKFKDDAFPSDFLVNQDKKFSVPRYYYNKLEKEHPNTYKEVKRKRLKQSKENEHLRLPERLEAKRVILKQKQKLKARTI